MKRLFEKNTVIFMTILIAFTMTIRNNANSEDVLKKVDKEEALINVYYFHSTARCNTCRAIENETLSSLERYYKAKIKSGEIVFQTVNMDEKKGEALAKELNVESKTLLFVNGDKKINLTNEAFSYAKNNPKIYSTKIKKTINKLLKK